jgi:hypothetical protein
MSETKVNLTKETNKIFDSLGIGTTGSNNAVALLQLDSTTQGFLPPRMTTAQRTAITGVAGLVVYDTDLSQLFVWI